MLTTHPQNVILTMLPEGKHVRTVYLDPTTGILTSDLSSKLLIDCSTIDPATSISVSEALSTQHPTARFYDAPVSGGTVGAINATMTFMLGCAEFDPNYPRLERLLKLMGGNIFACGGPSLGLTAKLCNNYTSAIIAIATSETLNIGIRAGMNPRVLSRIYEASTAGSAINRAWNPVPGLSPKAPASEGYKPGFRVELMRKDFALAVEEGRRVGARLELAEKGLEVYTRTMEDERCKGLDSRVVYRWLGGDEEWQKRFDEKGE